eukprot:g28523.t1
MQESLLLAGSDGVQLLFEEEGHDDAGIISMYLTEEPGALMTTGLDRRVRTWSTQLERLGTLMQSQDRHFKFPFDPQAAQEAWHPAPTSEHTMRLLRAPSGVEGKGETARRADCEASKMGCLWARDLGWVSCQWRNHGLNFHLSDAESAWRVTAEQVMQAPDNVEEDDFRTLFEQMERRRTKDVEKPGANLGLLAENRSLAAVHEAGEEASAAERLADAMAALGGDDYGTYAAMAKSLRPRLWNDRAALDEDLS